MAARGILRCAGAAAIILLLAACARPPQPLVPMARQAAASQSVEILVASNRMRADEPYAFSYGRSHLLNYQAIELEIPAGRKPFSADRNFPAIANVPLAEAAFARKVSDAAAVGGGEVTIYVHGFNTPHERAVLGLAQVTVDAGTLGAKILFSWPSRGSFLDYLTDRESALFSRDRLGILLRLVARQKGVARINLFAHSMGAFLAMETLRSAKLAGDGEFGGRLNAVVLAAPDIDLDVFRTYFEVIGRRSRPTVLLISSDDRALGLSRALSGAVERVGGVMIDSPEAQAEIARLGLIVVDLTKTRAESHAKFAEFPAIIRHLGDIVDNPRANRPGIRLADEAGRIEEFNPAK